MRQEDWAVPYGREPKNYKRPKPEGYEEATTSGRGRRRADSDISIFSDEEEIDLSNFGE